MADYTYTITERLALAQEEPSRGSPRAAAETVGLSSSESADNPWGLKSVSETVAAFDAASLPAERLERASETAVFTSSQEASEVPVPSAEDLVTLSGSQFQNPEKFIPEEPSDDIVLSDARTPSPDETLSVGASDDISLGGGVPHPSITVTEPSGGNQFPEGSSVSLLASAFDQNDLPASPGDVVWRSDVDGILGNGNPLAVSWLSRGPHVLTAEYGSSWDSVAIRITPNEAPGEPGRPEGS